MWGDKEEADSLDTQCDCFLRVYTEKSAEYHDSITGPSIAKLMSRAARTGAARCRAPAAASSPQEARRRRAVEHPLRDRAGATVQCWRVQGLAWEGQEAAAYAPAC